MQFIVFVLYMGLWNLFLSLRVMENQLREQKEAYESRVETLEFKNEHLNKENEQLQALFQEKSDVNHSIAQEVARLTAENMVGCERASICFFKVSRCSS